MPSPIASIPPRVLDLTNKIEWNKEVISRLNKEKAKAEGNGESTAIIDGRIAGRKERIAELSKHLQSFSNVSGGKKNEEMQKHIKSGFEHARNHRKGLHKKGKNGGAETPVENKLNPEFSEQKIVVPPMSRAEGAEGEDADHDQDYTRTVELKSNASGKVSTGIKLEYVAIGIVVAGLAWYAYKSYKAKKA